MTNEPTDKLIDSLCADLQPCKKLRHPCKCGSGWMAIALVYSAIALAILGIRDDLLLKLHDLTFLFEVGIMLAMSISAALATAWMRFPDMRGKPWISAVPYTLLAVFLAWTLLRTWTEGFGHIIHEDYCLLATALFSVVPVAAIIMMTRQGTTVCPYSVAMMNTLAVGGLGYACLRLNCAADTVSHSCFYHFLPFVFLGMVLGMAARKIFRW